VVFRKEYESYYNKLIDLINNTTTARNYSEESLREIITTSCAAYFAGDKTLDETIELIQNRARIFMSEKYG